MNPQAMSLLFGRKHTADHRAPTRREDEMPLHFLASNGTYRLVMFIEETWERFQEMRASNGLIGRR